ncbi:PREDICTED: uncharacterized protein C11orf74 homolog [Condylura cristata]|uniref:uncharacterized protein C11orf74 homolog n=1 Tax=Condylura cristata TaxID=143302 RepID=UPI00064386CC|nr:PREDICTED: uncharacterized protein C11orf74 homolog [Condylura cristata]
MPAKIVGLEIMDKDRLIEEVLDKFVNCHEQTYEEFLSTFTYLSKEHNVTKRGASGADSSGHIFTSKTSTHEDEANYHFRSKTLFLHNASEEEQIVLGEGQKVGTFLQGDVMRGRKVKVDSFLDLEDLDLDEASKPQMNNDLLLLPGEVEQYRNTDAPSYIPSMPQPLAPAVKPRSTVQRVDKQTEEIPGDEIQPFTFDEEFDYDSVMLTPKFTPAEIDAIKELPKQKRKTNTGLEEPCD